MHDEIDVSIPPLGLAGELILPDGHQSIIVFAHGSGSSRNSPRNRAAANALADAGFGALLLDLLTDEEARAHVNVFGIDVLADRLVAATDWIRRQPRYRNVAIGLFGSGTGAAAALKAAALRPGDISSLVFRAGRLDLAEDHLRQVTASTLLIVGGNDQSALKVNREAMRNLGGPARLSIVPGATHLFEEPGAMGTVIRLTVDWFSSH
jgi:putative phosphoribosyl transferase